MFRFCLSGGVPPVRARTGQFAVRARTGQFAVRARTGQFAAECLRCQFAGVAALRSALHSYRTFTTFTTRGLYLIGRHAGLSFPVFAVEPPVLYRLEDVLLSDDLGSGNIGYRPRNL